MTSVVASKKVYIKTYKEFLKETVHYKVNADKINVLTYDKKGKLSEEKVFKGLTKEEKNWITTMSVMIGTIKNFHF